jgi:hypothetical protein
MVSFIILLLQGARTLACSVLKSSIFIRREILFPSSRLKTVDGSDIFLQNFSIRLQDSHGVATQKTTIFLIVNEENRWLWNLFDFWKNHHYHHHNWQMSCLRATAFLRRFCQMESGFHYLDFAFFYQIKIFSLESNTQPGGSSPYIYAPHWSSGPIILPGTGFPFRRILRLAGLWWNYCNPPRHG